MTDPEPDHTVAGARRLDGRRAIVTGGSQGIGAAIVEKLCEEGALVAFLDIDTEAAANLTERLARRGLAPVFKACDLRDDAAVAGTIGEIIAEFETVDVLVNNAGVASYADAAEMTSEEWERVFSVDLKAAWLCAKYVLPTMRARRAGSIVNIASVHSHVTTAGMFPYAAAKAGVVGLTRSLALDEGPTGIRVNAVSPGYTATEIVVDYFARTEDPAAAEAHVAGLHPLRRLGAPRDIANVVAFVASDEASFMTGAEVVVDGGFSSQFPM